MVGATLPHELVVRDLGRLAYEPSLRVQRDAHRRVLEEESPQTLLLVEHDPVITISHRKEARRHLVASAARLAELGIELQETDRGGDITYHGPGQLVAYPILRLAPLGLNVGQYMSLLEQIVIDTAATFGVSATRDHCARGVWTEKEKEKEKGVRPLLGGQAEGSAAERGSDPVLVKLCAVGVRVRRNVTMHGLALNVTTDLEHFRTIVPCGLEGRSVTSLHELLGADCPTMDLVKAELVKRLRLELAGRVGAARSIAP